MFLIGKIGATHGLDGTVVLVHKLGKQLALKKNDAVFIELQKESFIPFFIEKIKHTTEEECLVVFEDVNSVEEAKPLTAKNVYIEKAPVEKDVSNHPGLFAGFIIEDKVVGTLGEILHVTSTGSQWLATVSYNGEEVLIPLVDDLIEHISPQKKIITMNLPDGLLDL